MKLPSFATVLIATAAAALLSACGARATLPMAQSQPMSAPATRALGVDCNVKGFWYLRGGCTVANLTSAGGTFRLPAYRSITFTLSLGANTTAGKDRFVFSDATGNGDITGKNAGKRFAAYSASKCVSGFTCTGTAVVYFSNINKGNEVGLLGPSSVTVADTAGFAGKKLCFPALSTPLGWFPDPRAGVKPSKTSFRIKYPKDKLFLPTGQLVLAYVCQ
jgi:hypothetical protein